MENQQGAGPTLMISGTHLKKWKSAENPVDECRSLVRILARKTENLYQTCRSDGERTTCIRTMESSLSALESLLNRLDHEQRTMPAADIMEDAHGFTYQSVRFCDLERISDK